MKRIGQLLDDVVSRDNLRLAFHKALRGKRHRPEARVFASELDARLAEMASQVLAGTYPVGQFHQFVIHDPKERVITAPCFPERVLHHAIMNVCEPHFDRWLIDDTYACRRGKGRLLALTRTKQFAARFGWFLKFDIRKYFDSISHTHLLDLLGRRFKDRRLLRLFEQIVHSFRGTLGRGLPIGALTSQHLANFYLGWFDRFVKETMRLPGYVRYMDDMVLWANDHITLEKALIASGDWLAEHLDLEFKPHPYINRCEHGVDFLGCRVHGRHLKLNRRSRRRFSRRLRWLEKQHEQGRLNETMLQQRATALIAFTRTPALCSWRFRRAVLKGLEVSGQRARSG